jgi:hypothetical protein
VCCGLCPQFASFHSIDMRIARGVAALVWPCLCEDCTSAANPDGASGREWCFVEARRVVFLPSDCLFGVFDSQEQAANAGSQKWDYCVPKPNYAEVRARVGSAFAEKAHELADAVAVVQGLSKEATRLPRELFGHFVVLSALWSSLCAQQPRKHLQLDGNGGYCP